MLYAFVQKLTHDMNIFLRLIIFLLYFMVTPIFQVMIFGTHKSDSTPIGRLIYALIASFCFFGRYIHEYNVFVGL